MLDYQTGPYADLVSRCFGQRRVKDAIRAQPPRSSHLGVVPDGFKIANVFLKRMEHENPPSVQVLIPDIVNINKWVADAFKNGVSGWDVNGRFQYFIPREEISEIRA